MLGLGIPEMVLILIVALLIFGPKKLPEIGKSVGTALKEFKKGVNDMKESFDNVVPEEEKSNFGANAPASSGAELPGPSGVVPNPAMAAAAAAATQSQTPIQAPASTPAAMPTPVPTQTPESAAHVGSDDTVETVVHTGVKADESDPDSKKS